MPGKMNLVPLRMAPASNSIVAAPPAGAAEVLRSGNLEGGSWSGFHGVRLNGVPRSESQSGQSRKDLRAGEDVGRASLRKSSLCCGHVQQITKPVVIGFKGGIVGTASGLEQCSRSLALAKGSMQIGVCPPNFVRDLIARNMDLSLRLMDVSFRLREPIFSRPSIKHSPVQFKGHAARQACRLSPRKLLLQPV